jgi:hypothetical protein
MRPILTMSFHFWALTAIASCSVCTAGINRCVTPIAATMYIADGNESLYDWLILT